MRIFRWAQRELESLEDSYQRSHERMDSEEVRQRFESEYRLAIARLNNANRRFFRALAFAMAATVFMSLGGIDDFLASAIMLILAPHTIGVALAADRDLGSEFPLPLIKDRTAKREAFAVSVWSISVCLALAGAMYYWGELEPGGGYWF